jgi:hypothetical protein
VQNTGRVGGGQPVGGACEQFHNLSPRAVFGLGPIPERAAVYELGDDVMTTFELADVMNGEYVRMIERRGHLRLALKAPARGGVSQVVGEEFDGDLAVEFSVQRTVNHTHATFANLGGNLVVVNLPEGHVTLYIETALAGSTTISDYPRYTVGRQPTDRTRNL